MKFELKFFKQNQVKWAIYGSLLSLGSPIGLYILHATLPPHLSLTQASYTYNAVGTFLVFTFFGFWAGRFIDRFEFIASHDILTKIYNRRYMQSRLEEYFVLCKRHQMEFLIMMLDLDLFKKVNDSHGHDIGDKVLKKVASVFKSTCRQSDIVSRWGGEEFIILCPQTDYSQGLQLAERIRKNTALLDKSDLGFEPPQTISAGLISVIPEQHMSLHKVLQQLDDVLYLAKKEGRNKVVGKKLPTLDLETAI